MAKKGTGLWAGVLGAAALGAAVVYLSTKAQAEPADGTLAYPYYCKDGSVIYLKVWRSADHAWHDSGQACPDEPADGAPDITSAFLCDDGSIIYLRVYSRISHSYVPSGQTCDAICIPDEVRNQLTDCWDGIPYGGERCTSDGMDWVPISTTCPPEPPDEIATTLIMSSGNVYVGSDAIVNVNLRRSGTMVGIPNKTVNVVFKRDGTQVGANSAQTDANGQVQFAFTPSIAGNYTVDGRFDGDVTYLSSNGTTSFVATAPPSAGYTVFSNGTVQNSVGTIVFTGTPQAAIQYAFDSSPNNGDVYIEAGTYTIYCPTPFAISPTSPMTYLRGLAIHNKTLKIHGAGAGVTILKQAPNQYGVNGKGTMMLVADGHDGMVIEDMTWDGNKVQNPPTNPSVPFYDGAGCIYTCGVHKNELYQNLEVRNSPCTGIYLGNAYKSDSSSGTGGPNGWAYYPVVRNIHFHDNGHMAFMHDACQCLLMEDILSERDCSTGRRAIWIEGNSPDYQTSVYSGGSDPSHPAILRNITLNSSHLRTTWVKNIEVEHLTINNPNAEMGASVEVVESINVHMQIDNLTRESVISGQGYGVCVGYLCPGTQISILGKIIAKVGVAMVNLGYENSNALTSGTDLTISGGTIQATQRGFYVTGGAILNANDIYLDIPSAGYSFYLEGTSRTTVQGMSYARTNLFYKAAGATFNEIAPIYPDYFISKNISGQTVATNKVGAIESSNANPTVVFQYACDHGATVYVASDTYYMSGRVLMNDGNSLLSNGARLVATASEYCFMRPRYQGENGMTNRNITVDGFEMDGAGLLTNAFAVNTSGTSTLKHTNINVKNCTAYNIRWSGFYMHNVDGGILENVEAYNVGDAASGYGNGIDIGFSYNVTAKNCVSHDNGADGYDLNADTNDARNITLDNCESYNNALFGNAIGNRSGIVVTQNGTGFKLTNCYIHDEPFFAIHDGGYSTVISGCIVEDNPGVGIQSGWRAGTTSVTNNIVRRCGTGIQLLGATIVTGNQISNCSCGVQNASYASNLASNTFSGNTNNTC